MNLSIHSNFGLYLLSKFIGHLLKKKFGVGHVSISYFSVESIEEDKDTKFNLDVTFKMPTDEAKKIMEEVL